MRFHHVFYLLLALSGTVAFIVPAKYTESARPKLGVLFVPVAGPSRAVAAWVAGRFGSAAPRSDVRPADAVYDENQELKVSNARMAHELVELRKIAADWQAVPIRDRCTLVGVIGSGTDVGTRESLTLRSGAMAGLKDGMFALSGRDVVGTLVTGKVGSQIRLVTDPQTKVRAYFGSFRRSAPSATRPAADQNTGDLEMFRLNLPVKLVEGAGRGKMICRNLPYADAVDREGLKPGDWAMVEDPDWPKDLQGWRLGVVSEVRKTSRMMAEIEIQPESNLVTLREVMVLTKEK